jgi:hypothetical protein
MTERPARLCEVDGCGRPHLARGYCSKHWRRWQRHGDPLVMLIGQDPEAPNPCLVCGEPIVTESIRIAPRICSGACLSRRRRTRVADLYDRVMRGSLRL